MKTNVKQNQKNMKKSLVLVMMIFITMNVYAQEKCSLATGIQFAPMMSLSLDNPSKGTTPTVAIAAQLSAAKGKTMIALNYSATNAVSILYFRSLPHNYGIYTTVKKHILTEGGYIGIGGTYQVKSQFLFAELGSGYGHGFTPTLSVGVLIPIKVTLTK